MTRSAASSARTCCPNRKRRSGSRWAISKPSRPRRPRAASAGCGMPTPIRSSSARTRSRIASRDRADALSPTDRARVHVSALRADRRVRARRRRARYRGVLRSARAQARRVGQLRRRYHDPQRRPRSRVDVARLSVGAADRSALLRRAGKRSPRERSRAGFIRRFERGDRLRALVGRFARAARGRRVAARADAPAAR